MRIMYDELKRLANLDKHGLDFALVTEQFFERSLVVPAKNGRYMAIGDMTGQTVSVVFKAVGSEAFAIVSLRPANRKERQRL